MSAQRWRSRRTAILARMALLVPGIACGRVGFAPIDVVDGGGPACVAQLAGAGTSTCAVRASDGLLRCWGNNQEGELGDGTFTNSPVPVEPIGLGAVALIATGEVTVCATTVTGVTWCWGQNNLGQVGDGSMAIRGLPVPTGLPGLAVSIATGETHSCAALADGTVWCWGSNGSGALGQGSTGGVIASPVVVPGVAGAVEVAVSDYTSCARIGSGQVQCWGDNTVGSVGDGTAIMFQPTPQVVVLPTAASQIAGSCHQHFCAVLVTGEAYCWGSNLYGQLGDGTLQDSSTPVLARADVAEVRTGAFSTCARTASGELSCWGRNDVGQLGDNSTTDRAVSAPVPEFGPTGAHGPVVQLMVGCAHTCALTADQTIWCWGDNGDGALGDGTLLDRHVPVRSADLCR